MSHQQETRFTCDRCGLDRIVPHNDQPAHERGKPPGDWTAMSVGGPTAPPMHLCPNCTPLFRSFMEGKQ